MNLPELQMEIKREHLNNKGLLELKRAKIKNVSTEIENYRNVYVDTKDQIFKYKLFLLMKLSEGKFSFIKTIMSNRVKSLKYKDIIRDKKIGLKEYHLLSEEDIREQLDSLVSINRIIGKKLDDLVSESMKLNVEIDDIYNRLINTAYYVDSVERMLGSTYSDDSIFDGIMRKNDEKLREEISSYLAKKSKR